MGALAHKKFEGLPNLGMFVEVVHYYDERPPCAIHDKGNEGVRKGTLRDIARKHACGQKARCGGSKRLDHVGGVGLIGGANQSLDRLWGSVLHDSRLLA